MAYDTELPADWLVGRHFAWQAKHVTELVGDQVTVFIGVPTYAQGQPFPWAENLRSAIRGDWLSTRTGRPRPRSGRCTRPPGFVRGASAGPPADHREVGRGDPAGCDKSSNER